MGRDEALEVAAALRPLVERERCLVVGVEQQATSYYLGCGAEQTRTQGAEIPAEVTAAEAAGWDVVAVFPEPPARGSFLASWQAFDVPGLPDDLTAYRPPG